MFYYDSFSPETLSGEELDYLLALGWFRMHQSLFTTSHVELGKVYRVHWLRFPVGDLPIHRSHRKLKNKNKKFSHTIEKAVAIRPDHAELHARYRDSITFNGPLSIQECLFGESDPLQSVFDTYAISVFDDEKLIAGGYLDVGDLSGASILNFYDPLYYGFSLGRYLILLAIEFLRQNGFQYYYPGYVVGGLSKMNYKLFLGREHAQYFDPITIRWKVFDESILEHHPTDSIPPQDFEPSGQWPH